MSKRIECGAVVPGCPFVAHGESEADVLMRMVEHARTVHDISRLTPQLNKKIHAAIHDDGDDAEKHSGHRSTS